MNWRRYHTSWFVVILSVVLSLAVTRSTEAFQRYKISTIGTFGGDYSTANAINNAGQVVGSAENKNEYFRAFLWKDGKKVDLGALGGFESEAYDINNAAQIVGWAGTGTSHGSFEHKPFNDTYHAFFWKGEGIYHAFLWEDGVMIDLGTLGGRNSWAAAINDSGQVVGSSETAEVDDEGRPVWHAFLWEDGTMIDLGTLGGAESNATDINDSGQVVGWAETGEIDDQGYPIRHAFVWENGQMKDLGIVGSAEGINDSGQVVGTLKYWIDDWFDYKAFFWDDGTVVELPSLRSDDAVAISNSGKILGGDGYAIIWDQGVARTLEGQVPADFKGSLNIAKDINEAGQIVGEAGLDTGGLLGVKSRAFVLTPTSETPGRDDLIKEGIYAIDSALTGCPVPAAIVMICLGLGFGWLGVGRR